MAAPSLPGVEHAIEKRLESFDFLRRASRGESFFMNSVLVTPEECVAEMGEGELQKRCRLFYSLALSVGRVAQLSDAATILRAACQLMAEVEHAAGDTIIPDALLSLSLRSSAQEDFYPDTLSQHVNAKPGGGGGGGGGTGTASTGEIKTALHTAGGGVVYEHYVSPPVPFAALDYTEVTTTLLDTLAQLYVKLIDTPAYAGISHVSDAFFKMDRRVKHYVIKPTTFLLVAVATKKLHTQVAGVHVPSPAAVAAAAVVAGAVVSPPAPPMPVVAGVPLLPRSACVASAATPVPGVMHALTRIGAALRARAQATALPMGSVNSGGVVTGGAAGALAAGGVAGSSATSAGALGVAGGSDVASDERLSSYHSQVVGVVSDEPSVDLETVMADAAAVAASAAAAAAAAAAASPAAASGTSTPGGTRASPSAGGDKGAASGSRGGTATPPRVAASAKKPSIVVGGAAAAAQRERLLHSYFGGAGPAPVQAGSGSPAASGDDHHHHSASGGASSSSGKSKRHLHVDDKEEAGAAAAASGTTKAHHRGAAAATPASPALPVPRSAAAPSSDGASTGSGGSSGLNTPSGASGIVV